ncbi:hypothetical protein J3R83DRAFT_5181 [Lanmaoa asiatica]|nr:hypothetical protein J3R83DRAFT_5181 [Lanmaoa asiatica]
MTARRFPDDSKIIEINGQHLVRSVFFTEDGKQVWSGGAEEMLWRWRVDDGFEAKRFEPKGWKSVLLRSRRIKDGRTPTKKIKVLDIQGHTNLVFSIDISPDSTKFATGASDKLTFI